MCELLLFIHTLVGYLALTVNSPLSQQLSRVVPKAMETARNITNFSIKSSVRECAVCPKCHSLYKVSECVLTVRGEQTSGV